MGFFRQIKDSFTNFSSYRDVAGQKTGKTIKYFFILFTIIFIVWLIQFAYTFNNGTAEFVSTIKEKIPEFRLANGQLNVDAPQPLLVDGGNGSVLIIDTTGQTDESVLDKYNEGVFISRDKLINKQNIEKKEISFADLKQVTLDKQKLLSFLPLFKWLLVIIAVFAYVFGSAWVVITLVIMGLIGLFINGTMKGGLRFGHTWNIAVYALTLPWLLETFKDLVYPAIPYFWAIKWGLALFLLYKGIEAANKPVVIEEPPLPPNDFVI
ncbi:MAG: DUF1189 domain-containing protein [Firmicutes bacterium]|nr:DUF1189 domain-containing protein [Bacillota bacterium]